MTLGSALCSTGRRLGAHGGGWSGCFGCSGALGCSFGLAFAFGGPRGDGVWVSSEELTSLRTAGSVPKACSGSDGCSVFWTKTLPLYPALLVVGPYKLRNRPKRILVGRGLQKLAN